MISQTNRGVIRGPRGSRGGRFITSGAEGSSASASAGNTSVSMFSYRIWSASSGSGQPTMRAVIVLCLLLL